MAQQTPKCDKHIVFEYKRSTESKIRFGGFAADKKVTSKLKWSVSPRESTVRGERTMGLMGRILPGLVAFFILMVTAPIVLHFMAKYLDWFLAADIFRQMGLTLRPQQVEIFLDKALDVLILIIVSAAGMSSRP